MNVCFVGGSCSAKLVHVVVPNIQTSYRDKKHGIRRHAVPHRLARLCDLLALTDPLSLRVYEHVGCIFSALCCTEREAPAIRAAIGRSDTEPDIR